MMKKNIFILLSIIFVSGCASVKVKPFNDFRDAVKNTSGGIENALDHNYKSSREAFAQKFSTEKDSKFSGLVITQDDNGKWEWSEKPSYVQIKNAKNVIEGINQSFCEYADLLCKLAAVEFLSEEDFESSVNTLNMNLRNAIEKAGLPKEKEAGALFTVAAVECAKSYFSHKRAASLNEALEENQLAVKQYCEMCGNLAGLIRTDMRDTYTEKAEMFKVEWEVAQTPEKKKEIVAKMLEMNDSYTALNEMLDGILGIYKKLPGIHNSLRKAIDNKAFFYEDLQELYSESQKITKLYEKLRKKE